MLTSVRLHNYKGFINAEVPLGRVNFLLGKNGSGKTSFLYAVHALVMIILEGGIEDFFTASDQFRFASFPTQSFALDVSIEGHRYTYSLDLFYPSGDHPPQVQREEVICDNKRLFLLHDGVIKLHNDLGQETASFPFGPRRGGLAIVDSRPENQLLTRFKEWAQVFLLVRLDPHSLLAEAKKPALHLDTSCENFVAWYETISNSDVATTYEFLQLMRDILPGLRSINLKPAHRGAKLLEVEFEDGGTASKTRAAFTLDELSEGQVCLIVLYAIIHFSLRSNTLVAFDEPDNFLSLAEIEPLLYSMDEAASASQSQLIIVSHHPEIYNRWASQPGQAIRFERSLDGIFHVQTADFSLYPDLSPAEVEARGYSHA